MLHQDPKHNLRSRGCLLAPFYPASRWLGWLAGRGETQGRRDVGHMEPLDQDRQTGRIPDKTARDLLALMPHIETALAPSANV